jgi:alpha-L-rhamnosidase
MFSLALQELASRGQVAPVVAAIRERWGDMIDHGATTASESFRRDDGAWSRSWCHAWSALPAYLLSAYVLGVRPLAPGFSHVLIAPELGDLALAEGQVPTPHGPIHVRAEQIAGRLVVDVQAPEGVVVEVRTQGTPA